MNTYIHILIFLIILFLYVHISNQYKKSEDLEIYEMDYSTNEHLQEVCDIKQPTLFEYKTHNPEFFENIDFDKIVETSGSLDVKVKTNEDYWAGADSIDFVVLPLQSATTLMTTDTHAKYFTENNYSFIEDAGLESAFVENDIFLKPSFTAQTKYDIGVGSPNAVTPLRYHTGFRHFICVTSGKIRVKMTPWRSHKFLYPIMDFDNYEFFSPINVWKPQKKYLHEMDKAKFLEFDVLAGYVLYVPPYWFYSIQYPQESGTVVCNITYNSIMNCTANLPNWCKYYLQQSNTTTRVTKTLNIKPTRIASDSNGDTVPLQELTNNGSKDIEKTVEEISLEQQQKLGLVST